jgi:tetratricopeptide (TPR) repeat protein
MERFAQLEPNNGEALYLYALVLSRSEDRPASSSQIESLLEKAIAVDSGLAPAYLELGILYSEKQQYPKAVELFKKASDISPDLAEAHYRLGLAYGAVNDTSRAQTEMATFKRLSKQADEALDRERREVQQFVYTLKNADGGPR